MIKLSEFQLKKIIKKILKEELENQRKYDISKPFITVNLLIGLPGAGKSTYCKNNATNNSVVISRDVIRAKLGYCREGEKVLLNQEQERNVSQAFNKELLNAAKNGKDIFIDNLNLKKKYRENYHYLLKDFNVKWVYVYIEAPSIEENIRRRKGEIGEKEIRAMKEKLEFPTVDEYDVLINCKQ